METRWLSPILINLDGSPPPVWLPTTNIWFDPQRYPIDDVVPVIRHRVAELGAPLRVESVTERVARLAKERDTGLRRKEYERSDTGREDLRAEISALFN